MSKRANETDQDYKKRVIDSISDSYCAAKWYNATIWLGSGMTTSCHHPPAHYVPVDFLKNNPKGIHNTPEKFEDRRMMLAGERPPGCSYCWKIEDMDKGAISDRVYKTSIFSDKDIYQSTQMPPDTNVDLKTLEISFDRTCNFACSYCNPAFSTTWVRDIAHDGAYQNLISDGRNHFTHEHKHSQRFKPGEDNPYINAFFEWWDDGLSASLQELRVTGGEPLMSAHFWRLIEWYSSFNGTKPKLAVNSNLCNPKVKDFVQSTFSINAPLDVYTSCESVDEQAEYIRDGLNFAEWQMNIDSLLSYGKIHELHIMATISLLSLPGLTKFMDYVLELRSLQSIPVSFTLNILRFPSFQSPLVLPYEKRLAFSEDIEKWMVLQSLNGPKLTEMESNHLARLIDYLKTVNTPHDEAFEQSKLEHDFKQFFTQYDARRKKSFVDTFPELAEWYESL